MDWLPLTGPPPHHQGLGLSLPSREVPLKGIKRRTLLSRALATEPNQLGPTSLSEAPR